MSVWNSQFNRDQVRDGAAIQAFLMPVFVDVMMDHPGEDRGRPFYPVVQWSPDSTDSVSRPGAGPRQAFSPRGIR